MSQTLKNPSRTTFIAAIVFAACSIVPAFAVPDSCETGGDAPNDAAAAQALGTPAACTGTLNTGGSDSRDYYRTFVAANNVLTVSVASASGVTLELLNPAGQPAPCNASPGAPAPSTCNGSAGAAGNWIIGVRAAPGNANPTDYTLNAAVAGTTPPDVNSTNCEGISDAGETSASPTRLTMLPTDTATVCQGRVAPAFSDMADWFTFRVHSATAGITLSVLPGPTEDVDVTLIAPGGAAAEPTVLGGVSQPDVFSVASAARGEWLIGIQPGRNRTTGSYTLALVIAEV